MKLLSGTANRPLAEGIARYIDVPVTHASVRRFADNELFVEILENMRGQDVFVIQPTSYPANDHLMELLDLARRLEARLAGPHHGGASPITAMPARTARRVRARPSRPSSSPI